MADTLYINSILSIASERKATDIHLVAGSNPVLRVGGILTTLVEEKVLTPDIITGIVDSFLSKEDQEKLKQKKEIVTIYTWADKSRFRAKVFYQKGYLAISLRLIPNYILSPKQLNIPDAILQLLNHDKGLLIVTGPFNSGRTTTVASLIETLNQNKGLHIQTLEKPIEYLFVNNQCIIEQREVGKDVNSFLEGVNNAKDEDIDVLFVSSVNEDNLEESILELSESGKLVIIILSADSVISSLERFLSNIDESRLEWAKNTLANNLTGVISQRLLPKASGGLTIANEVLTTTTAVQTSIKSNNLKQLESVMQTSKYEGMINLDKSLLELVKVGDLKAEDAAIQASNPEVFKKNF